MDVKIDNGCNFVYFLNKHFQNRILRFVFLQQTVQFGGNIRTKVWSTCVNTTPPPNYTQIRSIHSIFLMNLNHMTHLRHLTAYILCRSSKHWSEDMRPRLNDSHLFWLHALVRSQKWFVPSTPAFTEASNDTP